MFFDPLNDDLHQAIHDQISNIKISHNKTDRYKYIMCSNESKL